MRVDLFDFALPEDRIALRPASPRETARLLEVGLAGSLGDRHVADLPDLLRPGDVLVLNDTRVIRARLTGLRRRGAVEARVEVLLHTRLAGDRWRALARPAKRLRVTDRIVFGAGSDPAAPDRPELKADVEEVGVSGDISLRFDRSDRSLDEAVAQFGRMPLPPYIEGKRPADARDDLDYQTAYARRDGAVAAPTAGLHLTPALLDRLAERGVARETLTLHVGPGTFLPVKADDTAGHRMHAEWGELDASTAKRIEAARALGGRVVAVGTTSLRLLESAAAPDGRLRAFQGWTDIFITPGHRFRTADLLLTNFHLPRSTLFMLVSAFAGLDRMRAAYAHAIASGYRFYSYGDACLLERAAA